MTNVPEKPTLDGLEAKWDEIWTRTGAYRFDRSKTRDQIYSIDTPPPTASGTLHVGQAFSYTHTDIIARFQRMSGKEVFYPMGWDDNGLPTERRVQNYFGVTCDPNLPREADFQPPQSPGKHSVPVSRPAFVELCTQLTQEDEKDFEDLFRLLGLSVDWTMTYTTIGEQAQRVSQKSFLRLVRRGLAYKAEAPTLWDVDFRSAVAQAELEDREIDGAFHRVRFTFADGSTDALEIDTTRPELVPACVALVAHPDDERYRQLVGKQVLSPLFGASIPVVAHELADPEKGTGIAMICTFGDVTDVVWWRELKLPVRALIERDGTLRKISWGEPGWESTDAARAQEFYDELAGLSIKKARARIVEILRLQGALVGDPKPVRHAVKFFEKGDRPVEIVTSRQWFIKTIEFREEFLARGREMAWYPPFMRVRFEDWVNGLNGDWTISRQRYFGVPFPVWYPISADGEADFSNPILAEGDRLPVDPSADPPPGYSADQRDKPGGFAGDPDVMDTWATSSLTPQIISGWGEDDDLFTRVFPMDLRPQGHDIIRTWLFSTVARAHFENQSLPFRSAAISGMISDPDRKKMSKSKGGAVTPRESLSKFGSDGFRYWAASGRLGYDSILDEGQMKVGRRLATKILNASNFVLSRLGAPANSEGSQLLAHPTPTDGPLLPPRPPGPVTSALDSSMLAALAEVVRDSTKSFGANEYSSALARTENFFWTFCDDYLELVKARSYGALGEEAAASANSALMLAISTMLRLFAPILPFVTEEVWSWWNEGSIHRSAWPTTSELTLASGAGNPAILRAVGRALGEVRKVKTETKLSQKAEVKRLTIYDTNDGLELIRSADEDLLKAGTITELLLEEGPEFRAVVELADTT